MKERRSRSDKNGNEIEAESKIENKKYIYLLNSGYYLY
jgi:hypothetical protein